MEPCVASHLVAALRTARGGHGEWCDIVLFILYLLILLFIFYLLFILFILLIPSSTSSF